MKKSIIALFLLSISTLAFSQYTQTEGYYSGQGASLRIVVFDISKGVVAASTGVTQGSCAGSIAGMGQFVGRTLTITPYEKYEQAPNCKIKVVFDQKCQHAKIDTDGDCAYYSGAACTWEGQTVAKQKEKN